MNRVGLMRFLDVLAFRLYYRLTIAVRDREWERKRLSEICAIYAEADTPILFTHSPNSAEAEAFIKRIRPDIMLARCKTLLKESVFTLPATGTFVMHPGICPEYRNAHGCFWALANDDLDKVGMTLLRIDKGVDTGPVYGYFSYDYDESTESHIVISQRVLFDNLEAVAKRLIEIQEGSAQSVDTSGRRSAAWGQPWLTAYLKWKRQARVEDGAVCVPRFAFGPHEVPAPPAYCTPPNAKPWNAKRFGGN
jgi:methionyl-tRNA formyltransferase